MVDTRPILFDRANAPIRELMPADIQIGNIRSDPAENTAFYLNDTDFTSLPNMARYSTSIESLLSKNAIQKSYGLFSKLHTLAVIMCLDFSVYPTSQSNTKVFDTVNLLNIAQRRRRWKAAVSANLRMSRERDLAESLLAPSGAYLSWVAMDAENG